MFRYSIVLDMETMERQTSLSALSLWKIVVFAQPVQQMASAQREKGGNHFASVRSLQSSVGSCKSHQLQTAKIACSYYGEEAQKSDSLSPGSLSLSLFLPPSSYGTLKIKIQSEEKIHFWREPLYITAASNSVCLSLYIRGRKQGPFDCAVLRSRFIL